MKTYRSLLALVFLAGLGIAGLLPTLSLGAFLLGSLRLTAHAAESPAEASAPAAIIVDTPTAPHPKARLRVIDFDAGVVRFDWLNAQGQPVDTGDSLARFTVTGSSITAEQKQILAAAIVAATAQ